MSDPLVCMPQALQDLIFDDPNTGLFGSALVYERLCALTDKPVHWRPDDFDIVFVGYNGIDSLTRVMQKLETSKIFCITERQLAKGCNRQIVTVCTKGASHERFTLDFVIAHGCESLEYFARSLVSTVVQQVWTPSLGIWSAVDNDAYVNPDTRWEMRYALCETPGKHMDKYIKRGFQHWLVTCDPSAEREFLMRTTYLTDIMTTYLRDHRV